MKMPESLKSLLERLKKLRPIFESEPRVLAVFLFGSYVDGYAMPWSDIDLAVLYDEEVHWREHLRLDVRVSEALGTDEVDFLNLRSLPLSLQYRAVAGRIVYERDPARVSDYIQWVIVRYLDFLPDLEAFYREYDLSLETDYGIRPKGDSRSG